MQVKVKVYGAGAKKKTDSMRTAVLAFAKNIPLDTCGFMDGATSSSVLNGQYVNYISGNLRRSVTVERLGPFSAAIGSDEGIAPYAKHVRRWSERKYGKNYYRIAYDIFEAKIILAVNAEYARLRKIIDAGRTYTYQNPMPA
jgi:hypothetical protein